MSDLDDLINTWTEVVMAQAWGCGCCADTAEELRKETADSLSRFAHELRKPTTPPEPAP